MIEDYDSIMNMTDEQAAEILENLRIRIDGGRCNSKTLLTLSYNIAMLKAISKLKNDHRISSTKMVSSERLKQHFKNCVDVKLFTVSNICTIIDTFSEEVPDDPSVRSEVNDEQIE